MNIGTLTIEMAANVARLQQDMQQAKSTVETAMKGIEGAVDIAKKAFIGLTGVVSVMAFKQMIEDTITAKAELGRMAQQTGATVEALSGIGQAAKITGTSLVDVTSAMNKLQKALATTDEDGRGAAAALKALGIDFNTFKGMAPDQQMLAVAQAMDKFQDGGGKSAAAMLLFGKTGAQLLPLLGEIADKTELVGKQTTESAKQALEYEKNMKTLAAASQAWKRDLADALLPTLVKVTEAMRNARVEGGLLSAAIEGWRTLLTGDDRYKSDKDMVELTDQKLRLEASLAKMEAQRGTRAPNEAVITRQREQLEAVNAQLRSVMALRQLMDQQDASREQKEKARQDERTKNGQVNVVVPGAGNTAADTVAAMYVANLAKEYANLSGQGTKLGEVQEVLRIKSNKFTDEQIRQATSLARLIDQYRTLQREMESQNKALEADAAARQENEGVVLDATQGLQDWRKEMQAQVAILGLTSEQAERVTAQRRIQQEVVKVGQALDDMVNRGLMTQAAAQRELGGFVGLANRALADQNDLLGKREQLRTDPVKGMDSALRDYQEVVRRQGDSWKSLTGNFISGFEDQMSSMLARGKADWRSFFQSILQEAIRLQVVRPMLAQIFTPGGGLGGIAGGLAGSLGGSAQAAFSQTGLGSSGFGTGLGYGNLDLGGFFADGGRPPMGRPSVIGERGPELWVPDSAGTVVPNVGGTTVTYAPVIHIDARSDQGQVMSLVSRAMQENNQRLTDELRKQGTLA